MTKNCCKKFFCKIGLGLKLDLVVAADHISCGVCGYILSGWVVKEDYWGGCITLESPQ